MSEEYKGDYYHIVTKQSQAAEVVVPLPSFCKPLAASVRSHGGGEAGLLASYYDPEQHAWVVRQLPVHESWPHVPPPRLLLRVVTLVDPTNLYELRVSLSSILDDVDNDELYALQRRSQIYHLLSEEHLADKSNGTLHAAGSQGLLPHLRETVTLAASLDVMDGFVLTGGGYLSDFPILRDGPALPRSMDAVYDDVLAGDAFCGPPLPPADVRAKNAQCCAFLSGGGAEPVSSSEPQEYTAWSVTAAANAGLACFAIGLRRRSPMEWLEQQRGASDMPHLQRNEVLTSTTAAVPSFSDVGQLRSTEEATGLVASRCPSEIGGPAGGANLFGSCVGSSSDTGAPRPLLETLMLRGEVEVKLSRREGEEWYVSLPPPHGSFTFAMGQNRELMTVARKTFYCE